MYLDRDILPATNRPAYDQSGTTAVREQSKAQPEGCLRPYKENGQMGQCTNLRWITLKWLTFDRTRADKVRSCRHLRNNQPWFAHFMETVISSGRRTVASQLKNFLSALLRKKLHSIETYVMSFMTQSLCKFMRTKLSLL